jgi:flavin reductase (DIM6/NTAB) family NADH-FMN oxidoreductase RutF
MAKIKLDQLAFPVPICIVGTMVNGKINYATYGSFGLLAPRPKLHVYIGSQRSRYTNVGIRETGYFSVNIPPTDLMQKTDYVGIVSGQRTDKSGVFSSFFGSVDKAPLIEECRVNMVCRLVDTADLPDRDIFFGEVLETYVDEECTDNGLLDYARIDPLIYTMNGTGNASYRRLGDVVGTAYKEGRVMMKS